LRKIIVWTLNWLLIHSISFVSFLHQPRLRRCRHAWS